MLIIEVLYTMAGLIALSACIPQLKQLLVTRRADEFSLQTWIVWTLTQLITLVYVITIGNLLMICINCAWVSFYLVMTVLIFKYHQPAQATVPVEEPTKL